MQIGGVDKKIAQASSQPLGPAAPKPRRSYAIAINLPQNDHQGKKLGTFPGEVTGSLASQLKQRCTNDQLDDEKDGR